jgi:hypothetical protein
MSKQTPPRLTKTGDIASAHGAAARLAEEPEEVEPVDLGSLTFEDVEDPLTKTQLQEAQKKFLDQQAALREILDVREKTQERQDKILADTLKAKTEMMRLAREAGKISGPPNIRQNVLDGNTSVSFVNPTLDEIRGNSTLKVESPVMTIKPTTKIRVFTNEDEYTWLEFKQKVEAIILQHNISDVGAKQLLTTNLDGDAHRRFCSRPYLHVKPFNEILEELDKVFGVTKKTAMHTLTAVKQGPNEMVDSYASRVWMLAQPIIPSSPQSFKVVQDLTTGRRQTMTNPLEPEEKWLYQGNISWVEEYICMWFTNGLREEIYNKIISPSTTSFFTLRDQSITAERELMESGRLIYTGQVAYIGLATTSFDQTEELAGMMNSLKTSQKPKMNTVGFTSNSKILAAMDKRGKQSFPNYRNQSGLKACFDCGSTSHMRGPECPKFNPEKVGNWKRYGYSDANQYQNQQRMQSQPQSQNPRKPRGSRGASRGANQGGHGRNPSRGRGMQRRGQGARGARGFRGGKPGNYSGRMHHMEEHEDQEPEEDENTDENGEDWHEDEYDEEDEGFNAYGHQDYGYYNNGQDPKNM